MIRGAYNWNKVFDDGDGTLDFLFEFSGGSGSLGGDPRLPSNWIADFRRLYDFGEANRPALVVPEDKFNQALRIDTTLVSPLKTLPNFPADEDNLAFRNLARAKMVKLATGQQMATFLSSATSPKRSGRRSSRTPRYGSTSCARPSSTRGG
jgi:hypothetical protein